MNPAVGPPDPDAEARRLPQTAAGDADATTCPSDHAEPQDASPSPTVAATTAKKSLAAALTASCTTMPAACSGDGAAGEREGRKRGARVWVRLPCRLRGGDVGARVQTCYEAFSTQM